MSAKSIVAGDPGLNSNRGLAARHVRDLFAPRIASQINEAD
jgi:hypothetical protein